MSQRSHQPTVLVQCEFVRPQCEHDDIQPLFNSEYKRTNRTRATKIVRCFPHCCPAHRPRSYCGSALHAQISVNEGNHPAFTVLGRFEEHRPGFSSREETSQSMFIHLEVGQHVKPSEIHDQSSGQSPWVTGERLEHSPSSKPVYILHGSADGFNHWEHEWKSGTSQRQRLTQHHFRIYAFVAHSQDDWEVVGVATSPPFTFAVYRKHQHDPELLRLRADTVTAQATPSQSTQARSKDEDGDSTDSDEIDENQGHLSSSVVRDLRWHHQHRNTATATTSIAILALMARETDPGWLTMHPRSLFALIQAASETDASLATPQHHLLNYVNHCVPQLVALLPRRLSQSARDEAIDRFDDLDVVAAQERLHKWQSTMELLSGLLCFLLERAQMSSTLAIVSEKVDANKELYVRWIDTVSAQIEGFLQAHGQSTEGLVDDVVSIVLSDKARRGLHHRIRSLLRNTEVMGQKLFSAVCARLWLRLQHNGNDRGDAPFDLIGYRAWDGLWSCRGFEQPGDLANPSQHRQSWPQLVLPRQTTAIPQPGSNVNCGLLAGMAAVLAAFGFRTSRRRPNFPEDNHEVFCVSPIASLLDSHDHFEMPLDYNFRDAMAFLPVEWTTLLTVGFAGNHAFCRGRTLIAQGGEDGDGGNDDQIELEIFAVDGDEDPPRAWRCLLRVELASVGTFSALLSDHHGSPSRRLVVHVQIDKAHIRTHTLVDDQEPTIGQTQGMPSTQAHQLYSTIKAWSLSARFEATYNSVG